MKILGCFLLAMLPIVATGSPDPMQPSFGVVAAENPPPSPPVDESAPVDEPVVETPTLDIVINGESASSKTVKVKRDSLVRIALKEGGGPVRDADRTLTIDGEHLDMANVEIAADRKSALCVAEPGTYQIVAVDVGEAKGFVRVVATFIVEDPAPKDTPAPAKPAESGNDPREEVMRLLAQVESTNKGIEAKEVAKAFRATPDLATAIATARLKLIGIGANATEWQSKFFNGVATMFKKARDDGQLKDDSEAGALINIADMLDEFQSP